MKVTDLRLHNIRSYDDESVAFPDGSMLVHGENGSGKTTLLMGIFGGLFLSKIRNVGSNDFNLDDIVRRGADKGEIELTFEVENVPYTVTWTIDTEGQNSAELDSEALSGPISGIRDVRSEVIDIVGMDEDSFSRSVYVQQGEVDRLFDDDARAELVDDLLGLDRIDRYVSRMKGARRAANRLADDNEQAAENHRETIQEQFDYDVDGYESELADKESEIADVQVDIEEVEAYLEDLEEAKREVEVTLDEQADLQNELEEANAERDELVEKRTAANIDIEEAEEAIDEANDEIATLEERIEEKRDELATLDDPSTADSIEADLSTAEAAQETLSAAQAVVETTQIEQTNREATLEQAKTERERLVEEREELTEEKAALEADLAHLDDEMETVEADLEAVEQQLEEAIEARNTATESFLPDDLCPDSVTDETLEVVETRVEELTERKNELSEERAAKEASLEATESSLEDANEEITETRGEIDRLEERLADVSSELEAAREERDAAQEQFEEDLEDLSDALGTFDLDVSEETLPTLVDERIPSKRDELQGAIDEAKQRVTERETKLSTLEDQRDEFEALDGVATCPKCGQDVDPEHLERELDDVEADISDLEDELVQMREERDALVQRQEELDDLRAEAVDLRTFRDETVDTRANRVEDLIDDHEDLQEDFDEANTVLADAEDEADGLESEVAELRGTIETLEEDIAALESEIQEGDDLVDSYESVDALRDERTDLVEQLDDLQGEREDIENEISQHEASVDDLDEEIETQRTAIEDAENELDAATTAVETAKTQRELLSEVVDAYDDIEDLETSIDGHEKDIGHARETIENLNEQISGVDDEIEELEDELGAIDVEELREKQETVEERIEDREDTLDELNNELDSLQEERTVLENDLEKLHYFHDRLALAEEKREWAQDRSDEFDRMIQVYRSTKADLREQYLAYINEYTNDIFGDIYKNSSYQQVRILEEGPDGTPYAIQLLRDDGTLEHPSNASGGERAIVNLALRAGIYKLIAEMREGDTGRLPPFILDEPTTFLDKGHVGRLEQMLDSIAEWDVPQVIVVSHDERLIQGAEHEIEVSISEESNASQIDVHRGGRIPGDD